LEIPGIITTDIPNSMNKTHSGDIYSYWSGIDLEFMNRIGNSQAVYADGHHDITTSNHNVMFSIPRSKNNFFLSLTASKLEYATKEILNTIPNDIGFTTRRSSGSIAGMDMLQRINSGSITFNKLTDTLDIVAHSMGYAYALGMIDVLSAANIKFGRFYILAPENACGGGVNWLKFTEVWQYGSDLDQEAHDPIKEQDGVAPQCECKGLVNSNNGINIGNGKPIKAGRVFIPASVTTKSFVGSHSIDNYGWIFTERKNGMTGYVKPR
jgi:hypothetical protein